MSEPRKEYRGIEFLCQLCQHPLHDTGRRLKGAPLYECHGCSRAFRWWRYEWRVVEGMSPLSDPTMTRVRV